MRVVLRNELERRRRGLTQVELARRLRVSQQNISDVERGQRHEPTLRAMQQFFGMRAELLLRPVPASLHPEGLAEQTKQRFAHMTDHFTAEQLPEPAVPAPPSMLDAIQKQRSE